MGNYYGGKITKNELLQKNSLNNKLTENLRKTIESICYKNIKKKKLKKDEEIMKKYRIIKLLGSGLFSKVCLVTYKEKFYAMKIIKKKNFLTKESIQKILVEKEILKLLKHKNILKLYKTIQSRDRIYFLLEYISKGNLLTIMNIKIRLNFEQIRIISSQIIKALLYIHSKGIIYGDLKAENILIDKKGVVKLCDFNLSGTESLLKDSLQGTILYLAPEIIEGRLRTRKSDFWSLGVLIHLLFYRNYPFKNKSQTQLFFNILNRNIRKEEKLKAPNSLRKLILDLMVKDPERRIGENIEEFYHHPFFKDFDWNINYNNFKTDFLKDLPSLDQNQSKINYSSSQYQSLLPSNDDCFHYLIDNFTYENKVLNSGRFESYKNDSYDRERIVEEKSTDINRSYSEDDF